MSLTSYEQFKRTGDPVWVYLHQAGLEVGRVFLELSKIHPKQLGVQADDFNEAWLHLHSASGRLLSIAEDHVEGKRLRAVESHSIHQLEGGDR